MENKKTDAIQNSYGTTDLIMYSDQINSQVDINIPAFSLVTITETLLQTINLIQHKLIVDGLENIVMQTKTSITPSGFLITPGNC